MAGKVTMTLSLINSNNDFNFIVKFHYIDERNMMFEAFWRWWKLLQRLISKDNEKNVCQDLLTIENTDLNFKVHALHYANGYLYVSDFPFKNFANSPNKQNQYETIKNRFWFWLSIVWETHKLTRYHSNLS